MKLSKALVVLALFATAFGHAERGNLVELERAGILYPGASNFWPLYEGMLQQGFPNAEGHSMAAALLATCRTDAWDNRVADITALVKAMAVSQHKTIQCTLRGLPAQLTYSAATLACKMGSRSPQEMIKLLDLSYAGLLRDGALDRLHNVVVAAELVR